MTLPDTDALIVKATASLELQDVTLFRSVFERPSLVPPGTPLAVQEKRGVGFVIDEARSSGPVLRVRVGLGVRVVARDDAFSTSALIEADYLVDYRLREHVPEDAIKAFAEFNAIHNVWPFWRQHVFDIVSKAHLPRIDVPLFAGRRL